ncbi:OmpA family protein [Pseudoflavitalea sp. X16]|uniref:OmpA family protein n=1 Tax=Paraflavitalea devenefica TaxID=2716334 RepID=UPI00141EFC74|nr:OmpA family protein [Paraflavitalea devenefica]NII25319.1 OmpA family protein [Paraflavitalea devenefica]
MKKNISVTFLSLLFVTALVAQSANNPDGHSLFSMMPNYAVDKYSLVKNEFDQLKILVPDKKETAGYSEAIKEGELEVCRFEFKGDAKNQPSNLLILRNFKNAVAQKGGELIFEDKFYQDKEFFKIKQGGNTYWVKIYCDGIGNYTISSIKEAPMSQYIVLNAGQIKSGLDQEGKVAFYGIFFDVDKAVVKPESAPTLTAIAGFLKANPATNVFIVGHTDNTGDFTRNSTLSKDRATAVATELTTKYGVSKAQVTPQGVASLAPIAPNDTEENKAKNRRVEIVKK